MLRRLFYADIAERAEEAEEDASSVGSDWTQVSMGSRHSPNANDVDDDLPQSTAERRDSLSTTHSGEFARMSADSDVDDDYSTDDDILEGDEVDIAVESDCTQSGDDDHIEVDDLETEENDMLVVEKHEVENVLEDGTQYTVDSNRVAQLFDALSETVGVRRGGEGAVGRGGVDAVGLTTEPEWTDESEVEDEVPVTQNSNGHNYRHTHNSKLSSHLTIVAVVAVAIGVGVGIGHFIGVLLMSSTQPPVENTLLSCPAILPIRVGHTAATRSVDVFVRIRAPSEFGSTHSTWMRRQRVQRQQLEHARSLETQYAACADSLEPLKSELVEYRTKLVVCQTARRTCSIADKPPPCHHHHVVTVAANLSVVTDAHMRQMEAMKSGHTTLMITMEEIEKDAHALRADLRLCRMRHAEPKGSVETLMTTMPDTEALMTSLAEWASNMTTTVQSMTTMTTTGASSETGRVSAASELELVRLVSRVAEKTMVTALTSVWNKANTMLQTHRPLDFEAQAACHRHHFTHFMKAGANHFRRVIDALPPLLTYEDDFDLELEDDDVLMTEADNLTLEAMPTPPVVEVDKPVLKTMSRSDVYRFRKTIKRSPLPSLIGTTEAHAYLARLRPLTGRSDAPFTPRQRQWLTCQQMWWTNQPTSNVCKADELSHWQSSSAVSFTSLITKPWVSHMVAEWVKKPSTPMPSSVCVEDEAPACETTSHVPVCPYTERTPDVAWVFSRAQQRDEARQMHEREDWYSGRHRDRAYRRSAARQSDWLFDRQHHREESRAQQHQQASSSSRKNRTTFDEHLRSTWRHVQRTANGRRVKQFMRKVDDMF